MKNLHENNHMKMRITVSLVFISLMICQAVHGSPWMRGNTSGRNVINVPADQPTIQAGIDAANDGDIILIANGIYTGTGNFDIGIYDKSVYIRSIGGPGNCIIDCEYNGRGFIFDGADSIGSILQGVTVTNGNLYDSPGAGILVSFSSALIIDCVITNNTTTGNGGGIVFRSSDGSRLVNCIISGNSGLRGGGIISRSGSYELLNCLIKNNSAEFGGGVQMNIWTSCKVKNCTFYGNTANNGGAINIDSDYSQTQMVENSIIRDCSEPQINLDTGYLEISYSNIENGYPGTGNIDADPVYASGPNGDFYLSQIEAGQSTDSPCVNTGNLLSSDTCFDTLEEWVICLDTLTSRTDNIPDTSRADIGFHYGIGLPITVTPTITPTMTPTMTPTITPSPTQTPTPSEIISVEPASGSHSAPLNTNLNVDFLNPLLPDTVTQDSFVVHRGYLPHQSGSLGFDSQSFMFNPEFDFFCGETVQATITGNVETTLGPIDPYVWTFTTEVTAGTGIFASTTESLGDSSSRDVALGDLDGDEDLDAFVVSDPGGARVWINDGSGSFSELNQGFTPHSSRGISLGDLDRDGDLDALVVNSNMERNQVFLNEGNGQFLDIGQVPGESDSTDIALGDLDGDGDLDAFVTNFSRPNVILWNNGLASFSTNNQFTEVLYSQNVTLRDLNNNGTLDAMVLNFDDIHILLNDRYGGFELFQAFDIHDRSGVCLGDLDLDGDLDAFIVSNRCDCQFLMNEGDGWFVISEDSITDSRGSSVKLGDLDGDGDLDAAVTRLDNSGNRIYLNNGSGKFFDSGQILGNWSSCYTSVGDLDSDCDCDLFIVNKFNQGNRVCINQDATPTPHPDCGDLGCSIEMPQSLFHPGDDCSADILICNPYQLVYSDVPIFAILEIEGNFFFAPSFMGFDYFEVDVRPGKTRITILPQFTWPDSGAVGQAVWYAGMTDQTLTGLFGSLGIFKFGWEGFESSCSSRAKITSLP